MSWMFGNNVRDSSMYAKFVNSQREHFPLHEGVKQLFVLPKHGEKEGIH